MHFLGRSVVLAALLALASVSPSSAHQKWLWPNAFTAPKAPVWFSFDVTWSDTPFTAESGVGDQPIAVIGPGRETLTPAQIFVGKTKSTAEIEITKAGTYRFQAVDPLTYWTRVEQGAQQRWLKKPKSEVTDAKITRSDLYWSKAMAYVSVGQPSDIPPPDDAEPLDIVPAPHPNRITVGGKLELRVLSYGKPVPRAEIKVFGSDAAGHDPSQTVQCNEEGVGTLHPDSPGRQLISCELERERGDDPKADIHAFNVYLTLWIQPRTK
jgi:uncharacterized GH25 family protein